MLDRFPQEAFLRDGSRLLVRPFTAADTGALWAFFHSLPEEERRFAWDRIDNRALIEQWGVEPDIMGIGPIFAVRKLLVRLKMSMADVDVFELNEAFASQSLAVTRELGLPDDSEKVNPNGGAIAIGHPLGMSGARLVLTAARQIQRSKGRYALASMCIGVGQGIAIMLERV